MSPRLPLLTLPALVCAFALGACGSDDEGGSGTQAGSGDKPQLTVYSGRQEQLVGPLLARFEQQSGIDLQVRYGDSAELAATIGEEGGNSPADVFFAQDAGALGAVEEQLAPLPGQAAQQVDERFRDPKGRWTGVSGRARVVAYSTERLEEGDLPQSILDFTDPKWKGKIGFAPPNASFQAFISGMRLTLGDDRTRDWLEGVKANDPELLENNIQTEEAIAAGEIDAGFVNHYYLGELKAEKGEGFPVANHFLKAGDPGSLVNVAGVGVLEGAAKDPDAQELVDFLLSEEAQTFFSEKTFEYPLIDGIEEPVGTEPLEDVQGPDVRLGDLGEKLPSTVELLNDVGFTT